MSDFNEYKNQAVLLCNETAKLAADMGRKDELKAIEAAKEQLKKKEIFVLVCGEMKRGKSSLLGALLDEPDLFPTDVNVATNAVTVVSYGEKEKIEVVLEEQEGVVETLSQALFNRSVLKTVPISRSEIREYVTEQGNRHNSKNTKLVKIQLPIEKLKSGLVFVDTPGVGSLNQNHAEVTYGYLPNADVMLFVGDALSPFTQTELDFLQTAYKHCKTILFPLTKIDKTTEVETIAEANRDKISQCLQLPRQEIQVIPVSSTNHFSPNKLLKKNGNYEKLERAVWSTVYQKRSQILVLPSIVETAKELSSFRNMLNVQLQALSQSAQEAKQMEQSLKDRATERRKLSEEANDWKALLNHQLTSLGSDVSKEVQDGIVGLQNEVSAEVKNRGGNKQLDSLLISVNEYLTKISYDAKNRISDALSGILQETTERLKLELDVNEGLVDSIGFTENTSLEIKDLSKKLDRAIAFGRNITFSSMGAGAFFGAAGAVIAGGFGMIIGGPALAYALGAQGLAVGSSIGAAVGTVNGAVGGLRAMKQVDAPVVISEFNKYITLKGGDIKQTINTSIKNAIFEITQDIGRKLRTQISSLEASILDIQQSMKLSETQAAQKRVGLQNRMNILSKLEKQATELIYEIQKPQELPEQDKAEASAPEQESGPAVQKAQPQREQEKPKPAQGKVPLNGQFAGLEE